MTAPKATVRRRRRDPVDDIPADLAAWFSGEPRPEGEPEIPWSALVFPDFALLHERWRAWKKSNPGAKPPAGYVRLDAPDKPKTEHQIQLLAAARKIARRGRR